MMLKVLDIDNFDGKPDMNKMWLTILGNEWIMIPINDIDIN